LTALRGGGTLVGGIRFSANADGAAVLNGTVTGLVGDIAARVTSNTTLFNTQLGLDAAPGVADGGANRGRDNGNVHQCENVVCS
jgi:hypothetical protein